MTTIRMNILSRVAAATAIACGLAAATVIPASAVDNIKPFGKQAILDLGSNRIGYTVAGISESTDAIPYQISGRLYEATVTADALWGSVAPIVPMFNARAENGDNYRVLSNVWTPQGLSGAQLPPGGSTTGKLYFDVVGAEPNSVVYNDGTHDLIAWVP